MLTTNFKAGDRFKVKSNGFIGTIIGLKRFWGPGARSSWMEYTVTWDHHPYGTYTYDDSANGIGLISEWELLVIEKEAERLATLPEANTSGVSIQITCNHEWTAYQGLKECFDYCKKCDQKRSS